MCSLLMVIAAAMELGREAKRRGSDTVIIMPRNPPSIVYRYPYKPLNNYSRFWFLSTASAVQNRLHSSIATLQPPPMTVLSNACAGAR